MLPRPLTWCVCAASLVVADPADAVDVDQCSMVVEGRAEVIGFDASMADGTRVELEGILAGPDAPGPFPAIVMLPGGHGLFTPYCYRAVVEPFVRWGLVTLIVASTTARDENGNHLSQYSFVDQASHAHAAALAVSDSAHVDPTRLGLWGHSHGGLSVIDAVSTPGGKRATPFRAAVAASPECPTKAVTPTVPLLVMIGDKDTDVSVDACMDFAAQIDDVAGFEFFLIPDAGHLYWAPGTPGYDETAAKVSQKRLKSFLTKRLQATP